MGIGVDAYTCSSVNPLEFAVDDVRLFRDLLGAAFEGEPLADPDETAARAYLRTVKASMADEPGPLVMMWAGHATPSRVVPLRLLARDSDPDQDGGLDAVGDVASAVAYSGANQVLFVVDTCYSGAAVSATEAVAAVMAARPPDAQYVWVGVLASCLPVETARDGALGRRLRELLTHGPSDPVLRARWSVHNELIRGDDLCDAALKEWGNHAQSPQFQGNGSAWWMFRNPLYVAGAPERVVEHLLRAARGGHEREEHSWFTGRVAEVDQIVGWVRDGEPGVYVVTGSAGTGKSAIVGRVVSLSNPEERARLEHEGRPWVHADPGEGAVHAHVHARGLTADRAADELAEGLVRCGFLPPQEARRNASELVGEVQRAVEEGKGPPRLVIDGLDEARGESFSLAEDLVRRLARHAVVIVSTREVGRGDDQPSLLEALVPEGPQLNLDNPEVRERGRRDLRDYVAARLADRDERMDGAAVANRLVVDASMKAGAPFLLARLVTDQLIAEPVDTSQPDWQTRVSSSIEEAFDKDLARSTREWGASLGGEASAAAVARQCLRALTWGFGAGLPEDEWLVVVNAITPALSAGRDELSWVLEHLGRYIVQDGEGGVAVYRLAHQSLADYLRSPWQEQPHEPFDPAALQIARALLDRYRTLTEHGVSPFAPSYLWLYAWRHAASAGREGVDALRRLAEQQPSLLPDVGAASLAVVGRLVRWGRLVEAVAPSEEAVEIYRPLAAEDPAFEAHLAGALDNVGVRYSQIGRRGEAVAPTEEAVELYRALAAENPAFLAHLAGALSNLGVRYSQIGRRGEAVAPTEEAVELYRALAAESPAFLPDLASALNNLGVRYSQMGRRGDAVAPTEEAVELRRALAAENPAFLADLAGTLNNLGTHYNHVGRRVDAVAPAEEAVELRRALAVENPAFLPDLAMTLNNLGSHYSEVGRRVDAVAPTEEAVELYRPLAAENPVFLPDLASALNNLGNRYSQIGRRGDAVAPTEEAVELYRALAAENPAFLADLAGALNNLGIRYNQIGRRRDAVAPTEEAAELYRALAGENPAFLADLAMALNNVSIRYSHLGRRGEAVAPTEEAVEVYRALAAENPAFLAELAGTLNNLGTHYSHIGRPGDAVAPTEEAVELRRALAAENPAFLADLASALNNLGNRYSQIGRPDDAVAPTEEAVELRRALAAENPAFLADLAGTLNNLGVRYSHIGRRGDAVAPTEEAVELRRALAAENPAFLADLAGTLNNLGTHYNHLGRSVDAVAPTEEAVELYRPLAAENPVFLPDLASTLKNLSAHSEAAGTPERAQLAWQAALESFRGADAAFLLVARAGAAPPGDRHVAVWLASAHRLAAGDRRVLADLHDEVRRHREADRDGFDAAWTCGSGEPVPAWADVELSLLATAAAWITTPTYDDERDFLERHEELLDPSADVAVEEALLDVAEDNAERYTSLRMAARTHGVDAAYRPLLLSQLAVRFITRDAAAQRALVAERRNELLTDEVRAFVASFAGEHEEPAARRASALLELIALDDEDEDEAFAALEDFARFNTWLAALARRSEVGALAPAAMLMASSATTSAETASAGFYLAVAAAIAGQADDASGLLDAARSLHPPGRAAWIRELAELGQQHPEVLTLIGELTVDPSAEGGRDGDGAAD